jgi:polysaccharide deacetylase family protein (PEP-CTERM system associated)
MSVDVEDWPQSTLDQSLSISDRVVANTHGLLELMDDAGVKGTFFVLGKVTETYPNLVRAIADAGHEIGTHGYSHRSVERMPVKTFREELHRSVELLKQVVGGPILGHRAADFSISRRSLHLLEILAEEGLTYDSSIFPIRHPRYGVPDAWRHPHGVRCANGRTLVEFPLPTILLANMAVPVAGGGYLRLFPYFWTHFALRTLEREGSAAACYLHPYEIDPLEMTTIPHKVPILLRLSQGANRQSVRGKLRKLLSTFRFSTMAGACDSLNSGRLEIGLDLGKFPARYEPCPEVGAA